MKMALEGIRVLDVSEAGLAPVCCRILADMGAEVIKVERTGAGDQTRGILKISGNVPIYDINYVFEFYNFNKKGITLDLKQAEGQQILYKLVEKSDVFVCNFRPHALKSLGLEYETISKINPRIIYTHLSGYGLHGPEKDVGAYDFVGYWARSGVMAALGEPGTPLPFQLPGFGDNTTGMYAACAVLMALFHRERTGEGQEVCVSLIGGGIWSMGIVLSSVLATGLEYPRVSRTCQSNPIFNSYECADGDWLQLACIQGDRYWSGVCRALDICELENDPRFRTHELRMENHDALIPILDKVFKSRTRDEWAERLSKEDIIWTLVKTPADVAADPTPWANGYFREIDHPAGKKLKVIMPPWQFSKTPPTLRSTAPEFGQHTEEVLTEILGYSWDDVTAFKEKGVIR
ncbi:MAG TPA: CoA transferase [Dehalococcoidales bacterium]|nr:CoA transferase [Dehalococcoidales bacterium]